MNITDKMLQDMDELCEMTAMERKERYRESCRRAAGELQESCRRAARLDALASANELDRGDLGIKSVVELLIMLDKELHIYNNATSI